jgi:pimeloyl-ACP methyl ester carboxylesterase
MKTLASVAALALAWGKVRYQRIVLVAPPADMVGYSRRFARWHWMPEPVRRSMQAAIEERYGVRWEELEVSRNAPRLSAKALVIHDRDDRMVPWTQGEAFARLWPGARLLATRGLGHGRILSDERVTHAVADFISGKSTVAGVAAPALPAPAPLY